MRFIDLFAGLGGFHQALHSLGHECVFASEIDEDLRSLYASNFPDSKGKVVGDIRIFRDRVPSHDILCAGFPCQPFSKSGNQLGRHDKTRGTLFDEVLYILEQHQPGYLILENVGNFERHDGGNTWRTVRESLEELGYNILGTEHKASGGTGLLSPHHLGYPHSRERFFIVGRLGTGLSSPFPSRDSTLITTLGDIVQQADDLSDVDKAETRLTAQQRECIDHWNSLLAVLPPEVELPSFPLWGDEIDACYPYQDITPYWSSNAVLLECLDRQAKPGMVRQELLELLPSYARTPQKLFPTWKQAFIRQNRDWLTENRQYFPDGWVDGLHRFPPCLRKLEWNCKGEDRDLWKHVLQFRPSGLRVKRYSSSPALVAMTSTQIPILGPEGRFLTRTEGLRLQGFPDKHKLPCSHAAAFRALGNAVHVEVVKEIAKRLICDSAKEDAGVHILQANRSAVQEHQLPLIPVGV